MRFARAYTLVEMFARLRTLVEKEVFFGGLEVCLSLVCRVAWSVGREATSMCFSRY